MSGIICETASVHLSAAMPNFRVMECECDLSPFKTELADLAPGCKRAKDGMVDVPTGPGLGLEIDWEAVRRLRSQ
jgi:galactonate dehydratase